MKQTYLSKPEKPKLKIIGKIGREYIAIDINNPIRIYHIFYNNEIFAIR